MLLTALLLLSRLFSYIWKGFFCSFGAIHIPAVAVHYHRFKKQHS
jgi:hypothetical protein